MALRFVGVLNGQRQRGFAVFNSIGPTELIIVLVIVLLIFGPKRLPGLGKQLGSGMREFKDSISGKFDDEDDEPAPRRSANELPPTEDDITGRAESRERDTVS